MLFVMLAIAGDAIAEIPGLFAVQEASISDPAAIATTKRTNFGMAQFAVIGDLDNDKVQDLIVGAPLLDSGALHIQLLDANGKLRSTLLTISARDSKIVGGLGSQYAEKFGTGLAVIKPFSESQTCAVVMTSSGAVQKLWTLTICREKVGQTYTARLASANKFDTSSVALSGLGLRGLGLGNSIAVIDTPSVGERIVAVGAAMDGATASSRQGRVILLAIDPENPATMRRIASFPESHAAAADDAFAKTLVAGETFGTSIAPWRGAGGEKGMVVVSGGYTPTGGAPTGLVHVVKFGAGNTIASDKTFKATANPLVTGPASSIASGDFDHDGISDLVLGFNQDATAGPAQIGSVKVLLMDASGAPKDSSFIYKGKSGFIDTANALAAECWWGSRLATTDFDGDQQLDLIVSAKGNPLSSVPEIPGSIWPIRLKQAPWKHKAADAISLTASSGWQGKYLDEYVTGNKLAWSLVPSSTPGADPVATCKLSLNSQRYFVECSPGTSNGTTKVRVAYRDTGNIPSTVQFRDTLEFAVKVTGINNPPSQVVAIPKIVITEDHSDTVALVFSKYFSDPEGEKLRFELTPYDGSITGLVVYRLSADFDSLHLTPVQFKHGLCSLKVTAKDDFGVSTDAKILIEITHVNHTPSAVEDAYEVDEAMKSKLTELDVISNDRDEDGDVIVPEIVAKAAHGTLEVKSGKVVYAPEMFYVGPDSFTYKAFDGSIGSVVKQVKIKVVARKGSPIVYQNLRDTTVNADSDTIKVRADSLFFSGETRFEFEVYAPEYNCPSLAKVVFDSKTKMLLIIPFKYQSGPCEILIRDYYPADSIATKMNLLVNYVAHPYHFAAESLVDTAYPNDRLVVPLDSLDLERNELEYVLGAGCPSWVSVKGKSLVFSPDANSRDFLSTVMARKLAPAGTKEFDFTDTMKLDITIGDIASLRGRSLGGVRLDFSTDPGRLLVLGGDVDFRIDLIGLRGEVFQTVSGSARESRSIDLPRTSHVYLRLQEGGRSIITPLFLKR